MSTADATARIDGFSSHLREATISEHRATERAPFIRALLRGELPMDAYVAMTAQWSFLYDGLEVALDRHRADPILAPFLSEALRRGPALADDLTTLIGPDWRARVSPLPGTSAYVDRFHQLGADWPAGLLAHHYLRYLGDLSGGQIIARVVRKTYGLGEAGTAFYRFDAIADPAAFKAAYRGCLDVAALGDTGRERLIEEVDSGYRMTARIFDELAAGEHGVG